jgi:hypothetical protein
LNSDNAVLVVKRLNSNPANWLAGWPDFSPKMWTHFLSGLSV